MILLSSKIPPPKTHPEKLLRIARFMHKKTMFVLGSVATLVVWIHADQPSNTGGKATFDEVVASARSGDLRDFQRVSANFRASREQMAAELLTILKDSRSSNLARCAAAFYLGEVRAAEAANELAAAITLDFDTSRITIKGLPLIQSHPAMDAIAKIGLPSIPALVGNLKTTDDPEIRARSLSVLYRVEGDRDVLQLRLRRAIETERDQVKRARLQSAADKLRDPAFGSPSQQ